MVASSSEDAAPGSSPVSPQSSTQEGQVLQAVSPESAPILLGLQGMIDRLDAKMTARMETMQAGMDRMQKALDGRAQGIAEASRRIEQLSEEVADVKTQQSRQGEAWAQSWDAALSSMEAQLQTITNCIEASSRTEQKLKGCENRIQQIQQAQQKAGNMDKKIQTFNGKVQELTTAVGKLQTQFQELQRKSSIVPDATTTYARKTGTPSAADWQKMQQKLTESHAARAAEISELQSGLDALGQRVEELQAQVVSQDAPRTSAEVSTLHDHVQHLDAGLSAEAEKVRGVQHALVQCNAQLQEMRRMQHMWQPHSVSSMPFAHMPYEAQGQSVFLPTGVSHSHPALCHDVLINLDDAETMRCRSGAMRCGAVRCGAAADDERSHDVESNKRSPRTRGTYLFTKICNRGRDHSSYVP